MLIVVLLGLRLFPSRHPESLRLARNFTAVGYTRWASNAIAASLGEGTP